MSYDEIDEIHKIVKQEIELNDSVRDNQVNEQQRILHYGYRQALDYIAYEIRNILEKREAQS